MTNNIDTQTVLANFYGRLQADKLNDALENPQIINTKFVTQLSEHGVRVVDSTTGKTEYSNSLYTCAQAATPIRNLLVHVVAKAMKIIFLARQTEQQGSLGKRWTDFASQRDDLLPTKTDDLIHYVGVLKKESEKNIGNISYGVKIIGSASLTQSHVCADIDATCTTLSEWLRARRDVYASCYFIDGEQQHSADTFVQDLLDKRVAAKLQVKEALATAETARRANRDKVGKPLADKFQVLTGKPVEKPLTVAEAQKKLDEAKRLFDALDWLAIELELVADTTNNAGKLFYGLVRRVQV